MFEDDDEIMLVNPLNKSKKKSKPKQKAVASPPKRNKPIVSKRKDKPLQVQDCVGEIDSSNTFVVHVSGDEYWTIIKEDADRLTDHQIYCYFYKRFGYKAHELKIMRPAS